MTYICHDHANDIPDILKDVQAGLVLFPRFTEVMSKVSGYQPDITDDMQDIFKDLYGLFLLPDLKKVRTDALDQLTYFLQPIFPLINDVIAFTIPGFFDRGEKVG